MKDSLLAIVIIICCIGILAVYFSTRKAEEKINYVNTFSPEYQQNIKYLLDATLQARPDLPNGWFGYFCAHIPILQEQNFPWFTQRLKEEFRRAANYRSLYHMIVVGGMNVRDIDQPLLDASKKFRMRRRPNVEIVIVEPSTISSETKEILEKSGLKIRLVGPPSRDQLR